MAAATPGVWGGGSGPLGGAQRCQGTEGQRDIWPGHAASSFHGRKVVQPRDPSESREHLGKQGEPINKATWPRGPGGPG